MIKYKIIIIFLLISVSGLILPSFSFGQTQSFQTPETLEEAKEIGKEALATAQKELPGILEKIWKDDILPVWEKMHNWFMANIWTKIESWFNSELIKEEFQKEKQEIKKEAPEIGKTLWEKFKELIK